MMLQGRGLPSLVVLIAGAAASVWLTSLSLPLFVASHFDGAGTANGFMPRNVYVELMLVLVVGVPLLLALVSNAATGTSQERLDLPNREYWVHPERRDQTIACLREHGCWFAQGLAADSSYACGLTPHAIVTYMLREKPCHFALH